MATPTVPKQSYQSKWKHSWIHWPPISLTCWHRDQIWCHGACHHWLKQWLVTCLVPRHYLNQWCLSSIRQALTYFNNILFEIQTFFPMKCIWKISSAKCLPFLGSSICYIMASAIMLYILITTTSMWLYIFNMITISQSVLHLWKSIRDTDKKIISNLYYIITIS